MKILALDLGKYKTVACDYEAKTARHSFATAATTPKALHDLIVDREPDRLVIERAASPGTGRLSLHLNEPSAFHRIISRPLHGLHYLDAT